MKYVITTVLIHYEISTLQRNEYLLNPYWNGTEGNDFVMIRHYDFITVMKS